MTKTIRPSETKLLGVALKQISPFLKLVSLAEFETSLLPIMTKPHLRRPIVATVASGKQESNQISMQALLNSMVGDLNYGEDKISLSTVKVSPLTADWGLTESRVTGGGVTNLAVTATEISGQFLEMDAHKLMAI